MLVYEYVRNLSLDHALHSEAYMPLSWGMRLKITLGIARALNYLHSICVPPLAHRNSKSANVLLDEDLIPHVSGCCLAILKPLTVNSSNAKVHSLLVKSTQLYIWVHLGCGYNIAFVFITNSLIICSFLNKSKMSFSFLKFDYFCHFRPKVFYLFIY
ncbi:putative protein kinase RLK-Pelle-LRR-V family [Helianthus annuus]|nr:putative protein kinase RLK-Pelle-LRR-V family [Helianthus annuus]